MLDGRSPDICSRNRNLAVQTKQGIHIHTIPLAEVGVSEFLRFLLSFRKESRNLRNSLTPTSASGIVWMWMPCFVCTARFRLRLQMSGLLPSSIGSIIYCIPKYLCGRILIFRPVSDLRLPSAAMIPLLSSMFCLYYLTDSLRSGISS